MSVTRTNNLPFDDLFFLKDLGSVVSSPTSQERVVGGFLNADLFEARLSTPVLIDWRGNARENVAEAPA